MSSHYSSIRDGNQTTIPEDHLAKDYKAPGFRFASGNGGTPRDVGRSRSAGEE